jgi:hypothetical protein
MELSYFETLQMINLTIDRLDSLFEFWLSATFAAIVAGHLAGEKLTKTYAGMLTSIYLLFTFSVWVRIRTWVAALEGYFQGDLYAPPNRDLMGGSVSATLILGTLATVFFIWHSYTTNKTAGSVISSDDG